MTARHLMEYQLLQKDPEVRYRFIDRGLLWLQSEVCIKKQICDNGIEGRVPIEDSWKLERVLSLEPRDKYSTPQYVNIVKQHFALCHSCLLFTLYHRRQTLFSLWWGSKYQASSVCDDVSSLRCNCCFQDGRNKSYVYWDLLKCWADSSIGPACPTGS